MRKNFLSRRDFLKMAVQTSIVAIAGKLLKFFPEAEIVLAKSDSDNDRDGRLKHPLADIIIKNSQEVTDPYEKKTLLAQLLQHPDIRNVLIGREIGGENEATLVRHLLNTGNSLMTMGLPVSAQEMLVSYTLNTPLESTDENGISRCYQSQAMLFKIEEQDAILEAISVNSQAITSNDSLAYANDPCGGCVSPISGPWSYYAQYCKRYSRSCLFGCCGPCVVPCGAGAAHACLLCVLLWCPICAMSCCAKWYKACTPCATP